MSVVASVTSLSRPPMTPAIACGRSASAMTIMSSRSARSTPSSVVMLLAGLRAPDDDRRSAELGEIERVRRLAELVEHVVARVDDVVDRARPDRLEPLHQPVRARTDLHAADHHAHEPPHELRLGDRARLTSSALRRVGRRSTAAGTEAPSPFDRGQRERLGCVTRRDLARDAEVREQIRPVRADVDHELRVARRQRAREAACPAERRCRAP